MLEMPDQKSSLALALEYPICQHGGTEVLVRQLIEGLAPHFRLILVSPDATGEVSSRIASLLSAHVCLKWNRYDGVRGGRTLAGELRQQGVELVHFHFGGTYNWGSRFYHTCPLQGVADAGLPFLITTHGVFDLVRVLGKHRTVWMNWLVFPYVWMSRCLLSLRSRREIMVSKHDESRMRKCFFPAGGKYGQVYHSQLKASGPSAASKRKLVLCVGTIGARKGQWILTAAFARLFRDFPDWTLAVVGRTGDRQLLELTRENARPCGSQVVFVPDATDEEVRHYYGEAAIFAMPSLQEGLGLSLQEAISHGCVPIGSRTGGIPELIEHQRNGILVPPGDEKALEQGLRMLMTDPAVRNKFSQEGQCLLKEKEMSSEMMTMKYIRLYNKILHEKQP